MERVPVISQNGNIIYFEINNLDPEVDAQCDMKLTEPSETVNVITVYFLTNNQNYFR